MLGFSTILQKVVEHSAVAHEWVPHSRQLEHSLEEPE